MCDFHELYLAQIQWSSDTFGNQIERGPIGSLKHLAKEVNEVLANPTDTMEYADCLILLMDAAWRAGIGSDELLATVRVKQAINRRRNWPQPVSPDEPVEHIKES